MAGGTTVAGVLFPLDIDRNGTYLGTMKIAITGHTQGIGLALYESFQARGDKVRGFSFSTGYVLPGAMNQICDEAEDCDVFVNNVNAGFSQVDILYRMHAMWKGQDKRIINISSRAGTYSTNYLSHYSITKKALDEASAQLSALPDKRPRVINIKPGYVKTNSVKQSTQPKLEPQVIADAVLWILDQPPMVHISEISLMHMQYG